jgi:hypothetical protein
VAAVLQRERLRVLAEQELLVLQYKDTPGETVLFKLVQLTLAVAAVLEQRGRVRIQDILEMAEQA